MVLCSRSLKQRHLFNILTGQQATVNGMTARRMKELLTLGTGGPTMKIDIPDWCVIGQPIAWSA